MKNKGFSLVELLVIISIIGLLAGISTLSYRSQKKKAKSKTAELITRVFKGAIKDCLTYDDTKLNHCDTLDELGIETPNTKVLLPLKPYPTSGDVKKICLLVQYDSEDQACISFDVDSKTWVNFTKDDDPECDDGVCEKSGDS